MKNSGSSAKISGAVLFGFAGLTAAVGIAGSQIANAIVLGGFFAGSRTGVVPPGPTEPQLYWIVIVAVVVLAVVGLYLLISPQKGES